jgi:hypothetical protein
MSQINTADFIRTITGLSPVLQIVGPALIELVQEGEKLLEVRKQVGKENETLKVAVLKNEHDLKALPMIKVIEIGGKE